MTSRKLRMKEAATTHIHQGALRRTANTAMFCEVALLITYFLYWFLNRTTPHFVEAGLTIQPGRGGQMAIALQPLSVADSPPTYVLPLNDCRPAFAEAERSDGASRWVGPFLFVLVRSTILYSVDRHGPFRPREPY